MPDPISASIGGALISGSATRSAARTNAQAQADAAEQAYQQSLPWNTSGLFGGATFDAEGKQIDMQLSPELQAEYDQYLGDAQRQRQFISGMEADPMAAGKKFYEMQKALYAPEQQAQSLSLENRLLAQGMLGAAGGAGQMGALQQAHGMQDLQAQYSGLEQAQGMIDAYRQRAANDITMASEIGALPLQYAQMGQQTGQGLTAAAQQGAEMVSGAATTSAEALSGFGAGLGSAINTAYNPTPATTINLVTG